MVEFALRLMAFSQPALWPATVKTHLFFASGVKQRPCSRIEPLQEPLYHVGFPVVNVPRGGLARNRKSSTYRQEGSACDGSGRCQLLQNYSAVPD